MNKDHKLRMPVYIQTKLCTETIRDILKCFEYLGYDVGVVIEAEDCYMRISV